MASRSGRGKPKSKPAAVTTPSASPERIVPQPDVRRWIYGGLDLAFAVVYAIAIWTVIPNRLPSAQIHLWSFPVAAAAMGIGMLLGNRDGWWIAVISGSTILLSMVLLIVRILISAAFLAGVYGAFGKAAASFALVMIALVVELVALLPVVQVKYLMSRMGRRAYGVPQRRPAATQAAGGPKRT